MIFIIVVFVLLISTNCILHFCLYWYWSYTHKIFFENCFWICTSGTKVTKMLFLMSERHVQYLVNKFYYQIRFDDLLLQ